MTALAGVWDFTGAPTLPRCRAMLAAQAMYGQRDALGEAGPVAFGRRLWPMLPEDAFDAGPLALGDGTMLLAADIRLDDREGLAADMAFGGPLAKTSDAALAAAAIETWGIAAIPRLIGAFALALWDARTARLILARDALGERPLHYHRGNGFVAFASMPRGLHACPGVPYAADTATVAGFLALIPETGNESFFAGIDRVLPGEIVTVDSSGATRQLYWTPDLSPLHRPRDTDYAEALRAELDRAVACRLRRASGGVGAQLSAGLDSAIVATSAAVRLAPERLTAFTAVPAGPVVAAPRSITDEGDLAAQTAGMPPEMEHVRVAAGGDPVMPMDRQFQLFERPVLNPSNAVWSEAINDAARARGVGVLLTGQMGNFTISHDGWLHPSALLRSLRLGELARFWRDAGYQGTRTRALAGATLGPLLPPTLWDRVQRWRGTDLSLDRTSALNAAASVKYGVTSRAAERGLDLAYRPWRDSAAMRLWGLRRIDMGVYIKGTLAGWGLDLRDPTADRRLVELSLRIPEGEFIRDGVPRALARRAFADRLPPEVRDERRRGLQGADWPGGLAAARTNITAELDAFERCKGAAELIDIPHLRGLLADWPEGGWADPQVAMRYRHALQRAVAAGHFLRKVARTN